MSAARNTEPATNPVNAIPTPVIVVLVSVVLAGLAYAVLSGQIFLWFVFVFALSGLGLGAYLCVLFYRLVVAVERLAEQR